MTGSKICTLFGDFSQHSDLLWVADAANPPQRLTLVFDDGGAPPNSQISGSQLTVVAPGSPPISIPGTIKFGQFRTILDRRTLENFLWLFVAKRSMTVTLEDQSPVLVNLEGSADAAQDMRHCEAVQNIPALPTAFVHSDAATKPHAAKRTAHIRLLAERAAHKRLLAERAVHRRLVAERLAHERHLAERTTRIRLVTVPSPAPTPAAPMPVVTAAIPLPTPTPAPPLPAPAPAPPVAAATPLPTPMPTAPPSPAAALTPVVAAAIPSPKPTPAAPPLPTAAPPPAAPPLPAPAPAAPVAAVIPSPAPAPTPALPPLPAPTPPPDAQVALLNDMLLIAKAIEDQFLAILQDGKASYQNTSDATLSLGARANRAADLCTLLGTERDAVDWTGTISDLSSSGSVLAIKLGNDVTVGTSSPSDSQPTSMIDPASDLFNTISQMHVGERVRFSGNFFPSDSDCIKETSLTPKGSMTSPYFLMKFTAVAPQQ
jgi:hypothetical protein